MRSIPKMGGERTARAVACLGAALILLWACKGGGRGPIAGHGHDTPQPGGVVQISLSAAVPTFDPAIAYDELSLYAVHQVYDTLLGYKSAMSGQGL
ncbi:MAG: hypothetical protein AAGC55_06425, partial [Myxococcota bacterium]